MNDRFFRLLAGWAALVAAIGVIMGAFGAHALKSRIPPDALDILKTGVLYLFIHALACLLITVLPKNQVGDRLLNFSGIMFLLGVILFSGSLFLLSTRSVTGIDSMAIGIVTPFGGMCFITGWFSLAIWGFRRL
jgi:uncharacterized membrane protein YgdD (TMEM256/DUF423 family)